MKEFYPLPHHDLLRAFPPQKCGGLIEGAEYAVVIPRWPSGFPPQKCGGLIEGT